MTIRVIEIRAAGMIDEDRFAPYATKGPHGTIDASGQKSQCLLEKGMRMR